MGSLGKNAHSIMTYMSSVNLFQHMTYVKPIVDRSFDLLSRLTMNLCVRKWKKGGKSIHDCCSRGNYWAKDPE